MRSGDTMTRKAERAARQRLARTHAFEACAECKSGWVMHEVVDGHWRYELAVRCRCWLAHQAKVAQLIAEAKQA
jgi:hypothetical protein